MTQAQKTAKDKFKKAIAYRTKTGVSLKEAFAHIYGKKLGAVKKKASVKKATPKKKAAAKKVGFAHKKVAGIDVISNTFYIDRLNNAIKRKEKLESIFAQNKLIPIKLRTEFNKTIIKKLPNLIKSEKQFIAQLKKIIK